MAAETSVVDAIGTDEDEDIAALRAASVTHVELQRLVSAADAIRGLEGRPTLRFQFTLFLPHPMWPPLLHAFPVLTFDPDGTPAVGGERQGAPITIAVNATLSPDDMADAVAGYIVATARRQSALDALYRGERSVREHQNLLDSLDRASKSESIPLARALRSGRRTEVALTLSQWGYGLSSRTVPALIPDGQAFRARMPFFARCYNESPHVKAAVDRVVSAGVGIGPRATSSSEVVRRLADDFSSDSQVNYFAAHAMRDAVLMGASAFAAESYGAEPHWRLIRPDRLELYGSPGNVRAREVPDAALDAGADQGAPVSDLAVLPGTWQPGSSYPASILEPWIMTLYQAVAFAGMVREFEAKLPPEGERSAAAIGLAETIEDMRKLSEAAHESLRQLLDPVFALLPEARTPLYMRGHDLWP